MLHGDKLIISIGGYGMYLMKKYGQLITIPFLIAFIIGVASCTQNQAKQSDSFPAAAARSASAAAANDAPSPDMINGLDARKAMELANTWGTTEKRVTSHVTSQQVVFEFETGKKATVPMLDAKMLVAFAPYVSKTHPCENHYMSGCQGELVEVPVKVYGTAADGAVVVDDTYTTMKNGFFELWLPRDIEVTLSIEGLGKKAIGKISTSKNSNTCITTMQLL